MATPTTVVADDNGNAIPTYVPCLPAHAAHDVTEGPSMDLRCQHRRRLGAVAGHVARYVAEVADRVVGAVTGQVARLAAVVAGFLIGALYRDVPRFKAVVA